MLNWLFELIFGPTEKSFKKKSLKGQIKAMDKNAKGKVKTRQRRQEDRKFKKKSGW